MKVWLLLAVLFSISIICSGCGGDDNGDSRTPEQACRDVADAFGDLCERCQPGSYMDCYNELLKGVDGDCVNVLKVRDMNMLYDTCLPWIASVDCEYFLSGNFELDSSCKSQLLH